MKISVLIENSASENYAYEHGLSLFIEYNKKSILLDAGQTGAFSANAEKMGIDLKSADLAVLSHGHYDHSGGLLSFFEINKKAFVYSRSEITEKYYSAGGGMHEISVPEKVLQQRDRFIFNSANTEIEKNIYLVGHSTGYADIGKMAGLYKNENGKIIPDDFSHEQSLVFDTEKGLVIFNSCSHAGAENIIKETKEYLCGKKVYAYIGGLHMKGKSSDGKEICAFSEEKINSLCDFLNEENIPYICTGHCTGDAGFTELKKRLGEKLLRLSSGLVFEL